MNFQDIARSDLASAKWLLFKLKSEQNFPWQHKRGP